MLSAKTVMRLRNNVIPIERLEGRIDEVRGLIDRGLARLVVSEYPWGIELGVELTEHGFDGDVPIDIRNLLTTTN